MQEEVQQKTLTLVINASKLTAREFRQAISKYLAYQKNKNKNAQTKDVKHHGKQTVKQLAKQNQGMEKEEITNSNIKSFDKYARKYGVDYALKKVKCNEGTKYFVFFKAKDMSAIHSALDEFNKGTVFKGKNARESVLEKLKKTKDTIKNIPAKIKHKELDR